MDQHHLSHLARLRRARDLVDREYARPLDVPAMARHALMSPGHFSRAFRAAYGETPYSYLMTRRVERAMALYEGTGPMNVPTFAPVDHLADIAAVLGHETKMLTQDVLRGLQDRNPTEYGSWSFRDLRRVLDDAGHGEYKTGGRQHVSLDRILEAIAARDEDDIDDEGGTEI